MWGIAILADLRPMGVRFHAVVVFGLGKKLLFKSVLGHWAEYVQWEVCENIQKLPLKFFLKYRLFLKLDEILLHIFQLSEVIDLLHITDQTVAVQFMTVGNFAKKIPTKYRRSFMNIKRF